MPPVLFFPSAAIMAPLKAGSGAGLFLGPILANKLHSRCGFFHTKYQQSTSRRCDRCHSRRLSAGTIMSGYRRRGENASMLVRFASRKTRIRSAIAGLFFGLASVCFYSTDWVEIASSQTRKPVKARPRAQQRARKYSEFPHGIQAHKVECASCHKFPSANWKKVRAESSAFPDITDYPQHESCLNCHRQQFFKGARPMICSICHTNPSPRDGNRHPFPNPRETFDLSPKGKSARSDFQIHFPHDKHIDIVSAAGAARSSFRTVSSVATRAEESCSVCHTTLKPQGDSDDEYITKPPGNLGEGFWIKKGTFKTVPTGHTTCFTCHSQDSGLEPLPVNCAACHKIKQAEAAADFDMKLAAQMGVADRVTLDLWRKRESGKFRHEWFSHAELSCATCHNVEAMNTLDARTKKVPVSSCSTCHATATSDDGGALNFEVDSRKANLSFRCTKCHIVYGSKPIPESHLRAIAAATGK